MDYLVLKATHISFVIAWFAGLFYLPRIFVNLAMVESETERARLLLMANKLYRFMTPLGAIAIATGLGLWLHFGISGGWLHAKTTLIFALSIYHLYCGQLVRRFERGVEARSHRWFRVFNEMPVLVMFAAVFLVVLKPF